MSWGIRITILTLSFVCFMSFLVYKSMQQSFDLVAEDYYQQEIAYQEKIDKRTNQERDGINIEILNVGQEVIIRFPADKSDSLVKGNITFFYPANSRKDLTRSIALLNGQQSFPKASLAKGLYKIKIDYQVNGRSYYYENAMIL